MQASVARVAFFKSIYREYVDRADRYVSRLTRESNLVGGFHVQIRTTAAARNRCVTTRGRLSRSMRCRPEMQSGVNVAWMRSSLSVALDDYFLVGASTPLTIIVCHSHRSL